MNTMELTEKICQLLASKKCSDIVTIDVREKTDITNSFVLCTTTNPNQGRGAYDELTSKLEKEGIFALRFDGEKDGRWIVVDYDDVIVHIFHTDMRDFYKFEKLWVNEDGSNIKSYDL